VLGVGTAPARGTKKKNRRTPTWLVGSSEAKKVPGLVSFFPRFFYRVFELPSPRNAEKRDKKIGFGFSSRFFRKNFSTRFFFNFFVLVLLNSHR
jgi:hypothetical protein